MDQDPMTVSDRPTTRKVRRMTGKGRWSALTPRDRLEVARRCLRECEHRMEHAENGWLEDLLQDAESLIQEARNQIRGEA